MLRCSNLDSKTRLLTCGAAFVLLAAALSAAASNSTRKTSPDTRMSPMGRLATRVKTKLRKSGFAGVNTRSAIDNCVNSADDCEDGFSEGPAGGQAETSIAVDSTGQHIVIGFNDTRGFALNPLSVSGFMYSDDGGKTFVDGGQLPTPGNQEIGGTFFPWVFGDPDVKYLGDCNFVYSSILLRKFSDVDVVQTMGVHVSRDCGHTWAGPYEVTPASNPHGASEAGTPLDAADKEFIDVDPETKRVIVSWSNFTPFAPGGVEISSTYTNNILAPNGPSWTKRQIVAAREEDGQSSVPRFVAGSQNAYMVWRTFLGLGNNVGFAKSTDNGKTWGAPVDITDFFFTMDEVLGNDRVNTSPSLAVDNSGGPFAGNIYVVYANNNNHDGADVAFQRSTDQGSSFSGPRLLNFKPGNDRAQWFPWVKVDKNTGRVYVFYYDQGAAKSGDLTRVSYTFSDDGGVSWRKQTRLSEDDFHAGWGNDTGQPNLGDYNQAVAQGGELFATWAQTHLVGFTDGQPSLSMTTPDVQFKRTSGGSVSSPQVDASAIALNLPAPIVPLVVTPSAATTNLLVENFNEANLDGALPAGWSSVHGAGDNEVPWVTNKGFCGKKNGMAFHQEANDGVPDGSPTRWERLLSPVVNVPADADLVTLDFDVCYDTEDDPNFNIRAYDGFFLRVTDLTPGRTLRSVLAEAFEQQFTTDGFKHYPKHFPRSNDPNYFEDMSAWAGASTKFQHVHLEFPGMAGSVVQLRFEYTQDANGICSDVRPGDSCGVALDNLKMQSVKNSK
jgi:hypothetical protein